MRSVRFAICVVAIACSSCGGGMQRGNVLQATYGAYGQPAGYYPGRAEPFGGGNASEFTAWLAQNRQGIDEIQRRIVEMREGKRIPACIGQDKYTCVAALAQKMAAADEYFLKDMNMFAEIKYDVNGRPVGGYKISLQGYAPDAKGNHVNDQADFMLTLGPQTTVTSITASLPKDPILARTQEEYDRTRVYEVVSAVTAATCPSLSRVEVAKWIENTIKPTSRQLPKEQHQERSRIHDFKAYSSSKVSFCGRVFQFQMASGTVQHGFEHDPFEINHYRIEGWSLRIHRDPGAKKS